MRVDLAPKLRAVAGLFDLSRPYFGFDQANRYVRIGTTRSRGAEFSLSGSLTDQLTLVAGGVVLSPRVAADPAASGAIGRRPVGIPGHIFSIDANWDAASLVRGLSFDAALSHRGQTPATTDNVVTLPPRAQLDLGTRYRFTRWQDPRHRALSGRQRLRQARILSSADPALISRSARARLRPT